MTYVMMSTKDRARKPARVSRKNTTHLVVSWGNVLEEGCEQKYIEQVKIVVLKEGYGRYEMTHEIPFSQHRKSATVEANPCKRHIVFVKFLLTQDYSSNFGRNNVQSLVIEYNKKENEIFPNPFGDLLTTTVLPKVCLKKNGTVHIPKAPAALSECDVLSGDVEDSDFQEVGTTGNAFVHISY